MKPTTKRTARHPERSAQPRALWRRSKLRASVIVVATWLGTVVGLADCSHRVPYRSSQTPETDLEPNPEIQVVLRLLLIGDAGESIPDSRLLQTVAERATTNPPTVAVFLGDNIYPAGLPLPGDVLREEAETRLLAQIHVLKGTGARVFFIPGNHDWDNTHEDGYAAILRERAFVEEQGGPQFGFYPKDGRPGPECLDEQGVRLIFFDTQWWLHEHERPEDTKEAIAERLGQCLETSGHSVFLTHHPPVTYGPHGGYFDWTDHVFPFTRLYWWAYAPVPVLGSAYPLARSFGISRQDVMNSVNEQMMHTLRTKLEGKPPILWAAGHEHSLQVHKSQFGAPYTVVSGSGSKTSPVWHGDHTLYAHEAHGFMEVAFFDDRSVLLSVITMDEEAMTPLTTFRHWLSRESVIGQSPTDE